MKILVIHTHYKLKGGEDSVVANEIELLRSKGIDTNLISFSNDGHSLIKLLLLAFNFAAYRKVKQRIISFNPDVVHIHNLHFAGSASVIYAVKKFKLPIVYTLHNYRLLCPSGTLFYQNSIYTRSVHQDFPWNAIKKKVYLNSGVITFWAALSMYIHQKSRTWNAVNKFIVLGEHSRQLFIQSKLMYFADRMVVKPNFCYSYPSESVKKEEDYYLFVGRLSEEKGLRVLMEAFATNKLPLKVVGSGPLSSFVAAYESSYPNISFIGEMQKEQVNTLMEHAKALIFPSIWYETFGMTIIEAFSKGTPVIASDLGNLKNMIRHGYNGLRFEAGSSSALSEKVIFYDLLCKEERATYRSNAHQTYQENYTPEKNAAQLINLYQSLCSEQPLAITIPASKHSYLPLK